MTGRFNTLPPRVHRMMRGPVLLYKLGLGPVIGKMILLLTTTGRRSGQPRVVPLQYELIDGVWYVASARGTDADWVKNLRADPAVEVRAGRRHVTGRAELLTDVGTVADFLAYRLEKRPRMIGAMLRGDGVTVPPSRAALEAYAAGIVVVRITPDTGSAKSTG